MKKKIYAADFETTSYEGQESTEVWAAACCELFTEECHIFHSIIEQFNYFSSLPCDVLVYYHNLKFDGSFWLPFLFQELGFKQGFVDEKCEYYQLRFKPPKDLNPGEFTYTISSRGQWYRIVIKTVNNIIEIRDSVKLLPFSLKKIGESFNTRHKKLEMEYNGYRYAGCFICDKEKEYIQNDVFVLKEALEITFNEGHKGLTIGGCCLAEFKKIIGKKKYEELLPNLYDFAIDEKYGTLTAGDYIRKSYSGGWSYLVEEKANKVFYNGLTADVNSLYPYVMHSKSGNRYPIGLPTFWNGSTIPQEALEKDKYFFVRIKTRFSIKTGYLPFIQIKDSLLYKPTQHLKTSDYYLYTTGKYTRYIKDSEGNLIDSVVEMTLTQTDFFRILEHYELADFEILDGCYFETAIGIFDKYIDKYKEIKVNSEGAVRELAKLFSNNLYGKLAASPNSDFKLAITDCEDGIIRFVDVKSQEKTPGYIPVGSAITSYARDYTIRHAQLNYHGPDKPGFIYADTDSLHCDLSEQDLIDIETHPTEYGAFKIEMNWEEAIFVRQKTYIEVGKKNGKRKVQIICAGMPARCKELLRESLYQGEEIAENIKQESPEAEFIAVKRTLKDFKRGLSVPGKLLPKRIKGGIILNDTPYVMR